MSKYTYNKNFFEIIDNEIKAYWLGFLYADGCIERIYKNERLKGMTLELNLQSDDKGHLFRFLKDIESNVPIVDKTNNIKGKEYTSCKLRINNTNICRDLIKLGCIPQKSLILKFPTLEQVPDKFILHFIRGYFDGDGCVSYNENPYIDKRNNKEYINKNFILSFVGTYDFLIKLSSKLENYNIKCGQIKNGNCGKAFELRIYRNGNILNFFNLIYKDANVYLKRKYNKFQYAFEKLKLAS